jgi:hypothetical protein
MLNQRNVERERAAIVQDRWREEMLPKKLEEHVADIAFVGVALAIVGGAAGFFSDGILGILVGLASGLGVGVILVAIYSKASGRGQPISVVPSVDTNSPSTCVEE